MDNTYNIWECYFATKHAWLQKEFKSSSVPEDMSKLEMDLKTQLESEETNSATLKIKVAYALSAELVKKHVDT